MNKKKNNLYGIKKIESKYEGRKNYTPPQMNAECCRLNLNENLFGPSPKCLEVLKDITINDLCLYSLEEDDDLVNTIAFNLNIKKENVLLHNGSSEMIRMIFEMILDANDRILLPDPGWSYYSGIANINKYSISTYNVDEGKEAYSLDIDKLNAKIEEVNPSIVVITTPNMPTGNSINQEQLQKILCKFSEQIFIIDEAYWGYSEEKIQVSEIISKYSNVVFVRTFSKFYGLANERIGFCVSNSKLASILQLDQPLFKLSYISRQIAKAAIEDKEYYNYIKKTVIEEREHFIEEMNKIKDVTAFKSDSNFVYVKIKGKNVEGIQKKLQEQGYLIRMFKFNDNCCVRVTIYNRQVMNYVIQAFREYM